jgi:hypothetical protein
MAHGLNRRCAVGRSDLRATITLECNVKGAYFLDLGESFTHIKPRGAVTDACLSPSTVPVHACQDLASFHAAFLNIARASQVALHRHFLSLFSYPRVCRHPALLSTPPAICSNRAAISEASAVRIGDGRSTRYHITTVRTLLNPVIGFFRLL